MYTALMEIMISYEFVRLSVWNRHFSDTYLHDELKISTFLVERPCDCPRFNMLRLDLTLSDLH